HLAQFCFDGIEPLYPRMPDIDGEDHRLRYGVDRSRLGGSGTSFQPWPGCLCTLMLGSRADALLNSIIAGVAANRRNRC
ncbi:hypothetical protein, partial [Mesorhizobium sp. LSHC426A00]|uniref:hypothetical protein n=1 Tax=Mesorhizobium sp. LSHC426A00 TaxID=1287298 RepID=UPI001AEC530C